MPVTQQYLDDGEPRIGEQQLHAVEQHREGADDQRERGQPPGVRLTRTMTSFGPDHPARVMLIRAACW
jgi:hypothetical protein